MITLKHKDHDTISIAIKRKIKARHLSEQDKNHIRFIVIHNMVAKDIELFYFLIAHNFKERFKFDRKKQMAYYIIKLKKGVKVNAENKDFKKSN